ncbi:transglycosylase SLT domain-containing protein [Limimaricola sp. ASW11-118]|uniref:Transglycosylase SLT domain-containing protein n=1 Tax=Limimaricola litoreus TaxID=2955316 RepID=A0A9X2FME4_9RHOB|nr:transglycosylase SLT domain-containing protein [Limimaricola litoreus]
MAPPGAQRPVARDPFLPKARWDGQPGTGIWTRGLMAALRGPAAGLAEVVPDDIATWCPAYAENPARLRRAFWVGVMSALSRFESRHRADAVGGGGLYHGLLQILPGTARGYGCVARNGAMLRDPLRNLSCAARIMARTVSRDRAVALKDGRRAGIGADWGPISKPAMRAEMAAWTREQSYCKRDALSHVPRPEARPIGSPPVRP